jgi:hypothetical protein
MIGYAIAVFISHLWRPNYTQSCAQ